MLAYMCMIYYVCFYFLECVYHCVCVCVCHCLHIYKIVGCYSKQIDLDIGMIEISKKLLRSIVTHIYL